MLHTLPPPFPLCLYCVHRGLNCSCLMYDPRVWHRKGQIPPQYMGAVKQNAIHAAVLDACRHAIE
jgi:hypothetical protein